MTSMRTRLLLALSIACAAVAYASSCATNRDTCVQRADEAYRYCNNPQTGVNRAEMGEEPVRGMEAQDCRTAHQQALDRCDANNKRPAPTPDLDGGTISQ